MAAPTLPELTPTYIRQTYLAGMALGDYWGVPAVSDPALWNLIAEMREVAQGKMGVSFCIERFLTYPDPALVLGVDYQIEAEPLMYSRAQPGQGHFSLPLPFNNIRTIERVRMFYGNPLTQPDQRTMYTIPPDWITFTSKEGILRISPSITNAVLQSQMVGGASGGFDSIYYGIVAWREIPAVWAVDGSMGLGRIPSDVARWIALGVAMHVLSSAGAAASRNGGLASQSLSKDGLTQSESYWNGKYGPFTGAITALQESQDAIDLGNLRLRYRGMKVAAW